MCGKDCQCQQTGFRARRAARLGYANEGEMETTANNQLAFIAEPFEFDLAANEWESDEWEAEGEGEQSEADLYGELSDEVRRRPRRPVLLQHHAIRRINRPRVQRPRRHVPRWPFRFPLPRLGAVIVGQPMIEQPPATEKTPSSERAYNGGPQPYAKSAADSEPSFFDEPPANNASPADGEPTANDEPPAADNQTATGDEPQAEGALWASPFPQRAYQPPQHYRQGRATTMNRQFLFQREPSEFSPELEYEFDLGEFQQEFESGKQPPRPKHAGEIVICGGKPLAVLDNFNSNAATLRKDRTRNHPAQVNAIARAIISRRARRQLVPSVCIVGHTDDVGSQAYNYGLGLERARAVKKELCKALGQHASSISFAVNSLGEMEPAHRGKTPTARAGNRRVDVHLLTERQGNERCAPSSGKKLPPDTAGCGVPRKSPQREFEISSELEAWKQEAPKQSTGVRPKLCLYQDANETSHRNHFHHQAFGTARRIGAIGSPDAANCKPKVGATPYKTGAEIIAAIRAAWQCAGKKPIQTVHIFGHSGSSGVYGTTGGTLGLYQNSYSLDAASRRGGGRTIADIPTDILSDNVVFVLHGCNQALGCNEKGDDDNFARSLLEHLAGALKNPKVYGHYNYGCAGRDNSWCVYTKALPKGKAYVRPDYTDPGGCAPASKEFEFEFEWQGENGKKNPSKKPRRIDFPAEDVPVNICDKVQRFRLDGFGRGVHQLSSSQQAVISQIKSALRKRKRTCGEIAIVQLEGHASNESNADAVGLRRAEAVKKALEATLLRTRQIFTTSAGTTKPVNKPATTDADHRKNRRVDILVM